MTDDGDYMDMDFARRKLAAVEDENPPKVVTKMEENEEAWSPPLLPPRPPKDRYRRRSSSPVRVINDTLREPRRRSPRPSPTRIGRLFEESSIITLRRVVVKGLNEGVDFDIFKSFFEDEFPLESGDITFMKRCDLTHAIIIEFQTLEASQSVLTKSRSGKIRYYVFEEFITIEPCPELLTSDIHTASSAMKGSGTTTLSKAWSPPLLPPRPPKDRYRRRSSSPVRVIKGTLRESRRRSPRPSPTRIGRLFEESSIIALRRVVVKGLNEGVDLDIVKSFFEDEFPLESGDITFMNRCDLTYVIIIEFQTLEASQSILTKARSGTTRYYISKDFITIEPCPEKDKKCLLVNCIDVCTTKADIAEYLHDHCAIARETIKSIQFGTKEEAAVIQFDSPRPDIGTIRKRLSKRPFRGKLLRFDEVDTCRSIIVQNGDPGLSEDAIVSYFSRMGLSSGGEIDTVHIFLPLNAYVVVFRFAEVAQRVLAQIPHIIYAKELTVEPFFATLQATSINEITTQEPLIFNDLDGNIIRFVRKSEEYRNDLECKIETINGTVVWPCESYSDGNDESETHLKVICTIDPSKLPVKSLKVSLKNWQQICSRNIQLFFEQFETTRKILVAAQVWSTLTQYIDTTDASNWRYRVALRNSQFFSVRIVGRKEFTKDLYAIIALKADELEKDFVASHKTHGVQKVIQLNSNEMFLLRNSIALDEIGKRVSTVVIKPLGTDGLELSGRIDSIEEVLDEIQCSLNSYSREVLNSAKHGITYKTLDLLKTPETKAYITDKIDEKIGGNSKACYGLDIDKNVEVWATDKESLKKAIVIIRDSIEEKELKSLTPRHRAMLFGNDGDILFTSLQLKHMGLFISYKNKNGWISFVTVDSLIEELEEMISLFIDNHEIISEFIEVGSGRLAYLLTYKANELEAIEDEYRQKGVEITVIEGMKNGFSIKGEKQYCREVGWRLHLMVDIIIERSHGLKWDGFHECLKGNKGPTVQSKISTIGFENKCVLKILPNKRDRLMNASASLIDTKFVTTIGSLNKSLYLVAGDITDLDVDIAVVPSHSNLELSGGVGRVVGAKGGFEIQKECCDIVKAKNGRVSSGDVFVTTSGNLSVKGLLHAVTPYNDDFEQDAEGILASLVDQCISKASALGWKSIVFPLVGSGHFNFACDAVAEILLTNIITFLKEENNTVLERVYICDLDEAKLKNVIMLAKKMLDSKDNDDSGEIPTNRQCGKSIKCDVTMEPLAELQADVFVNAATQDINLRVGALGRAILDVAGDEVLDDIKHAYPVGVRYGEVAISNTGRMKDRVKEFFHGQIPNWSPNHGFAEIVLSNFVTECLQEASRRSHRSVAFPALGCGKRGYPPDVVVTTMLRAITEFSRKAPRTTVDLVKFVIPQNSTDLFKVFNEFVSENKCIETRSFVREYFDRCRSFKDLFLQRESPQIQVGPVSIKLALGNITMESAHAIVNSTNVALDLKLGRVSSMLLFTAGKVIQLECNTDEKKKQAQENKIVTTGPGRLLCKKILHLVAGKNIDQWRKCVKRCLRTAEAENLPTVSFPAIGTGQCGQSAKNIADALATTVKQYVESTKYRGVLRAIRIVIFDQEVLDVFRTTINKRLFAKRRESRNSKFFMRGTEESFERETDVNFHIFAETAKETQRVIQELHSLKTEEKIAFPSSVVSRLSESQEHAVTDIGKRRRTVIVGIDRKDGCIAVTGLDSDVAQTKLEIERYLANNSKDHWNMNVSESPKLVELQKDDSEYKMVQSLCDQMLHSGTYVKIERVQNPLLYIQFEERKREMTPKKSCRSRTSSLWYGGKSAEDASYISNHGFGRLCGTSSSYGTGVHFTKHARTAYDDFCSQDLTGVKVLMLVDVLVSDRSSIDLDVVQITESNQAYPKFIVWFKQQF
ncbi:protein mono-ADP-ribosyltransferase PARP14-like isoform X2 [Mya arenaria]|uniref:protein mono-ADP-ribosyltransferase PARP14-like isoform X2 n=1 Tax=Mya arenaria TaxID=6604 RepID=UPI0022E34E1E|nr:protein mono-ADP-ribosyltransferase PARP14-like isoform X2 [Mya arenaria]